MRIVVLLVAIFYSSNGFSQADSAALSANTPSSLQEAFQKEYIYLASQKQALLNLQKQTDSTLKLQTNELKSSATKTQNQVVAISSKNDEQHEYLMQIEKRKKELEKKGSSLENSYKKALSMIQSMESGLKFEISKDKETSVLVPEDLKISSFEDVFNKANSLIASTTQTQSFEGSFLNTEDKLVEGTITRFGRSAAIGSIGDAHFVLAPNGSGLLKALLTTESPKSAMAHLFVFDNLAKEAKIKHPAGFVEKIADFSPILFLSLILLLVGGLFAALIKV